MPYIKQEDREKYDKHLVAIRENFSGESNDIGHLTYCIYSLMMAWLGCSKLWYNSRRYHVLSAIIAAATDAAAEFRRCELTPYEETKIKENGYVD